MPRRLRGRSFLQPSTRYEEGMQSRDGGVIGLLEVIDVDSARRQSKVQAADH